MAFGDDTVSEDDKSPFCAINSRYVAHHQHGELHVQPVSSHQQRAVTLPLKITDGSRRTTLAFSPTRLNLLAVADGSQVLVYDVESANCALTLKGNGRTVSALAFDESTDDAIAVGGVDGSIYIWSLKRPLRPWRQLNGTQGACDRIAFASTHTSQLASLHCSTVSVWTLETGRPICNINVASDIALLTWPPSDTSSVLAVSTDGDLHLMRLPDIPSDPSSGLLHQDLDSEDMLNNVHSRTVVTAQLGLRVRQAYLLGDHGVIVLPMASTILYFYSYAAEARKPTELWRLRVSFVVDCFVVRTDQASIDIAVCSHDSTRSWTIPPSVLDGMGCSSSSMESFRNRSREDVMKKGDLPSKMCPRTIVRTRPRQRRGWRPRTALKHSPVKAILQQSSKGQRSERHAQSSISMHSSLELPKPTAKQDRSSPIPFLSPSIPARRSSSDSIPPLEEVAKLQPGFILETISLAATEGHESDSDDDTFAEHMQESASFLPGGLNVPLPRTCGARFSSNGQLLTFFPTRTETISTLMEPAIDSARPLDSGKPSGISNFFPSFGNLEIRSDADRARTSDNHAQPAGSLQNFSFDSRQSWTARTSPAKQAHAQLGAQHRVNIRIHDLEKVTPTRKILAMNYRLAGRAAHMPFIDCQQNAVLAMDEGLDEAAEAWTSLAMTLESPTPDPFRQLAADGFGDPSCERTCTGISNETLPDAGRDMLNAGFAASQWTLQSVFARAEQRADVQLLACMSTFLTVASEEIEHRRPGTSTSSQVAVNGGLVDAAGSSPGLPEYYTTLSAGNRSTFKLSSSRESSANPSQPTTPYIDSASSTPPLAHSNTLKQSAGLSASGSASPERSRTSFSIAAKNYAASIVEKFNAYGSSPPTHRTGTSPGNELSSSLPNTTGSWSKSVSFASTSGLPKPHQHSLSLAQEDDEYDSDKTLDNSTVPSTPRNLNAPVVWKARDESAPDGISSRIRISVLPPELQYQCHIWRECYAEHLRSWDLVQEATELAQDPYSSSEMVANASKIDNAVMPTCHGSKRPVCSICYCAIRASMQLCPSCLHTTHPRCLEEILLGCQDTGFSCPSGCGCDCSSIRDVHYLLDEELEVVEERPMATVRKRRSLTDPLRLRQRLQGESW